VLVAAILVIAVIAVVAVVVKGEQVHEIALRSETFGRSQFFSMNFNSET
jgi:hypothetical protein